MLVSAVTYSAASLVFACVTKASFAPQEQDDPQQDADDSKLAMRLAWLMGRSGVVSRATCQLANFQRVTYVSAIRGSDSDSERSIINRTRADAGIPEEVCLEVAVTDLDPWSEYDMDAAARSFTNRTVEIAIRSAWIAARSKAYNNAIYRYAPSDGMPAANVEEGIAEDSSVYAEPNMDPSSDFSARAELGRALCVCCLELLDDVSCDSVPERCMQCLEEEA